MDADPNFATFKREAAAAQKGREQRGMTPMAGDLHLNPNIAPKVRGNARPFAPGEWIANPGGSWSSELTATVQDRALNDGKPTVIPTLWLIDGKPTRVQEDMAARLAVQSGLSFQSFEDMAAAEKFANDRESGWQNIEPKDAGQVAALWLQKMAGDVVDIGGPPNYNSRSTFPKISAPKAGRFGQSLPTQPFYINPLYGTFGRARPANEN